MYNYIFDNLTKQYVNINSNRGKTIINNYLNYSFINNRKFQIGGDINKLNVSNKKIHNANKKTLNLLYMAKPGYGGWVSFTAHLSLKYNLKLYKIGNRSETNSRPYGYGVTYQNLNIDDILKLDNILITAIDKNYYKYLDQLPNNTRIVIHDPTEVKGKSCQPVLDNLSRFKVITIRETVKHFLTDKYNIKSEFLLHPFYEYTKTSNLKQKAVSISRIDYDKHTEVILKANSILKKNNIKPIEIYGAKNDLYVYRVLRDLNLDSMSEKDPKSNYKGRFDKSFEAINKILSSAKWMVDLSAAHNDGGKHYTFLEAIYQDCCLILSDKWINNIKSEYKNNYNCLIVKDENDIVKILKKDIDVKHIVKNAKKLLEPHIEINWLNELL